jgi:transposase
VRTRNKPSKLNHPGIIHLIRRFAVARLKAADKRAYSLQLLTDKIQARFQIKGHKSTLWRFLKTLGLDFAWKKTK